MWKHPEWKARSAAFTEGKACAWCGAKTGDIQHLREGKTRKVGLSPHHIEPHKWGLPLYKQIATRVFSRWWQENKANHSLAIPEGLSSREKYATAKNLWTRAHKEEITEAFEAEKQRILADYVNLTPEKIIILCGRCHYYRERGMIRCDCNRGYYDPKKYIQCYECNQEARGLAPKEDEQ